MSASPQVRTDADRRAALHRIVRLTARGSGLLFAAAVSSAAIPSARRASPWLYVGFAAAHATHFAAVSRFAMITRGRNLFPGGRSLSDAGGWPTVLVIFTMFGALVVTGRTAVALPESSRPRSAIPGRAAVGLIGAMFVGTYAGQLRRSRWFAIPATLIGLSVTANLLAPLSSQLTNDQGGSRGNSAAQSHPC